MILKKNQSGRSMVEMLGVLAIIGVLSVAAIAGYRYAMNKKTANDIMHEVLIEAIYVAPQLENHGDLKLQNETLTTGHTVQTGYVRENLKDTYNFFITVEGVSSAVCREIARAEWREPYDIAVVATAGDDVYVGPESCGENENVDIDFMFDGGLKGEKSTCSWEE